MGAECTVEQHRTPSGPQQTVAPGSLSEQVLRQRLQRPSLRVEAGERLLWGRGGWAREGAPPFPEAGEDPTVLAPLTLPPQTRLPPSFPSQGTRATPGVGQGPWVWASLKRLPFPSGDVNLGLTGSPAPTCFLPLSLALGCGCLEGLLSHGWADRGSWDWVYICILSECALQPVGTFRGPWAQLCKGHSFTSPSLLHSLPLSHLAPSFA